MLTKQTFDTCILLFLSWLPTKYSVDKWRNQHMDIWWCPNTFGCVEQRRIPVGGQGGAIAPPVFNIRITEINE